MSVATMLRELGWERIGPLKVDIEGHEKELIGGNCERLHCVDAMCIEWHVQFGESEHNRVARQFGFGKSQRVNGIWFMSKPAGSIS